jgi:putative IMPACT (imprinted ancient) family translation regulator
VVVVRYFGGTLLGVSGLIEAYGQTADECLAKCEKSVKLIFEKYEISCEYGLEQEIYKAIKQFNGLIHVIENQDLFCAEIKIPLPMVDGFKNHLQKNHKIHFKYIGIA